MKLSILTATYNRDKYLTKLYESIKQNLKYELECEWIIVDDGSTDKTKEVVQGFIDENIIPIKYSYQENSGKMEAINEAMNLVTGDIVVDCDSDDIFVDDAFHLIRVNAPKLFEKDNIYALIFLKEDFKMNISGQKFREDGQETTMFDLYFKEGIEGEKILVFNAEIRKKYKHEIEAGEKFVTEARMYYKMEENYKAITINEVLEQGEYIEDGYTNNIDKFFVRAPYGYYNYFKEILSKDMEGVLFKKRVYAIKHYILFSYLTRGKFDYKFMKDRKNKILYTVLYVPGIVKSIDFVSKM